MTDEDYDNFYNIYWDLEAWMYYEAEIYDQDPINYAYSVIGGTNPVGQEPSREEYAILEELYYKNWADLPQDMKDEYSRIVNKVWEYIIQNNIWDLTPLDLAARALGKSETEPVKLSEEALRHFIELYEKDWDDFSE